MRRMRFSTNAGTMQVPLLGHITPGTHYTEYKYSYILVSSLQSDRQSPLSGGQVRRIVVPPGGKWEESWQNEIRTGSTEYEYERATRGGSHPTCLGSRLLLGGISRMYGGQQSKRSSCLYRMWRDVESSRSSDGKEEECRAWIMTGLTWSGLLDSSDSGSAVADQQGTGD